MLDLVDRGARLVTLVGSAGVGKTRLASELLSYQRDRYDAAALVRLDGISRSSGPDAVRRICDVVIAALRISNHRADASGLDVLVDNLQDRQVLLILDNCEHLQEAIADVVSVLVDGAPDLTIVATSRAHLQIAGEHIIPVSPLSVPDPGADRDTAMDTDAVRLLSDRAAAAGRPLSADDDWQALVDLVRWSDGVPLVLEHIAAQLGRGRTPKDTFELLDGGTSLTYRAGTRRVPAHHQSIDLAVSGSWDLCSEKELLVWARLSVFADGFTRAAVEEVCSDGTVDRSEVLGVLEELIAQSVVQRPSADGRYRQHTYVREYGRRRLTELGELERVRARHCDWVAGLVRDAAEKWFGHEEILWLRRVHAEMSNISAAVDWCAAHDDVDRGLAILTDVLRSRAPFFFATETHLARQLDELLQAGLAEPTPARIFALAMLSWLRTILGDQSRATAHLRECLRLAERAGLRSAPPILFCEGTYDVLGHADPRGFAKLDAAREGFLAAGALGDACMVLLFLAIGAGVMGPASLADTASDLCLEEAERHGAEWAITWALWTQDLPARTRAGSRSRESLPRQINLGDLWGAAWGAEKRFWRLAADGDFIGAARLAGGSSSMQRRHGARIGGLPAIARQRQIAITTIIEGIGQDEFTQAHREGEALTSQQVFDLALADGPPMPSLTARQLTVARRVSEGMTTHEIAEAIHFSKRTVEKDLKVIFRALGLRNRTQVAAWYNTLRPAAHESTGRPGRAESPPRRRTNQAVRTPHRASSRTTERIPS